MVQPPKLDHHLRGLTRLEALFCVVVIGILFAVVIPTFTKVIDHNSMTLNLYNGKQIYLGIAAYTNDHNGQYPQKANGTPFQNANEAYRTLIPTYISSKRIFHSRKSPWTPGPPWSPDDKVITGVTPAAGENAWAYVPNLAADSNPLFPIIATGFAKDTPGTYSADFLPEIHRAYFQPATRNASPHLNTLPIKEFDVAVVRRDGSARLEKASTKDFRVYEKRSFFRKFDIFQIAPNWLRPDQAPLNPEG